MNVSMIHERIGNAVTVRNFYSKSKKAILERVLRQEILAVELESDFEEHTHLSETLEGKLKRFSQIFAYGMYVLMLMYVAIFYF